MIDPNLIDRSERYLKTPTEDWQSREAIGLTDSDLDSLHNGAILGTESWRFYYAVNLAHLADLHY